MGSKGVGEIKIMPNGDGYEAMILAAPDSDWGGVLKSKKFDTKDAAQAWAEKEVYGTRNIVVFDPESIINSVKRDGEVVFKKETTNALADQGFTTNNPARLGKKEFWSGEVDLRDLQINEVHPYDVAEGSDFHHSLYFSPQAQERMKSGESTFFWIDKDSGKVNVEWRETYDAKTKKKIIDAIERQVVFKKEATNALADHEFAVTALKHDDTAAAKAAVMAGRENALMPATPAKVTSQIAGDDFPSRLRSIVESDRFVLTEQKMRGDRAEEFLFRAKGAEDWPELKRADVYEGKTYERGGSWYNPEIATVETIKEADGSFYQSAELKPVGANRYRRRNAMT
jgi:hypothetical protein